MEDLEIQRKRSLVDLDEYREQIRGLLVEIVRRLVDKPQDVDVSIDVGPKTTIFQIHCAKDNAGQVIGAQGKTIMGLRAIVHAMCARTGLRAIVEIPLS